jgi:outer membrane protein TolC
MTTHFHKLMVCFLVFFISNTSFADDLSFSEAWSVLNNNNDGLAASFENQERSRNMIEAAEALYLPEIGISAEYAKLDDEISVSPTNLFDSMPRGDVLQNFLDLLGFVGGIPNSQINDAFTSEITNDYVVVASLNAVWPVYTGGRITAAQDIAANQLAEAGYLTRVKQQALFEALVKVYFGVVLANRILETQTKVEQGLYKHFDNSKKLQKEGQIARVERLVAEASYDKSRVEKNKAKRSLEIAQVALNHLLKEKQDVHPTSILFTNNTLPSMSELTMETLRNHPGLGVLDSKRKQAEGLVDAEKGAYLPEVFLFGTYNLYEQDTFGATITPDWMLGVGIEVPIMSRGGRSGKLKAARTTIVELNYLTAQAIQDLKLLVEKTWREANTALEEYNGLESSLALAHENIRLRDIAYAQGLSTSSEVVDANLFLAVIETQRQVAAYEYVVSLGRLLALSDQMVSFANYQSGYSPL